MNQTGVDSRGVTLAKSRSKIRQDRKQPAHRKGRCAKKHETVFHLTDTPGETRKCKSKGCDAMVIVPANLT